MKLLSLLFIFVLILNAPASAQERKSGMFLTKPKLLEIPLTIKSPAADFSKLQHTRSSRIDKVIDGLTLLLKDGTIIRLSSIDIPDFNLWDNAFHSEAALKLLQKKLPKGTEVTVYQTRMAKKGRVTRMNHQIAHILTKKDNIWVQGLLLAHGLSRVQIAPSTPGMADQMFAIEKHARTAQLGLWGKDSPYLIHPPTIESLKEVKNEFIIVEGTVQKTSTVHNNVYLNFGDNWKTDFTVMITPAMRKKLAHQNIDVLGLANKKIRARGWLKEYNGPFIELGSPAHLEYPTTKTKIAQNK